MNYQIKDEDLELLVNFSGGIDSTFLLYKLLKEKRNVLVHHCVLENPENRGLPENVAVNNILNWLVENNLNTFKYITSGFHYGNLGYIVRDVEVIAFMSSVILRNPLHSSIKEIAISANSEDETIDPNEESMVRRNKILDAILPKGNNVKLIYPIIDKSKQDIIKEMPEDLFKMTWFCRTPLYFASDNTKIGPDNQKDIAYWSPCRSCKTCIQVFGKDSDIIK